MASILEALEDLKACNTELRADYAELKASNAELVAGNAEIKAGARELIRELAEVKAQLAESKAQLADAISITNNLSGIGSAGTGSSGLTGGSSAQSYASVLARSINPSSSASLPNARTTNTTTRPIDTIPPGVTIDTRRMKDKSNIALDNIPDTEKHLKTVIQAVDTLKEIKITGIQVRGHNVRVLTPTDKEAALLRTNDGWVNQVFEGARTRGEDWHPVKIDDAVKAAVVKEDGYKIQDGFSERFCAENGVTGVMKTFWMSKGSKPRGSVAVFLANAEEARRMIEHRLVKIGGQIAFASEFQKIARPTRCYNCNQYGHYQSRCVNKTTCGKCSSDHRTDSCTAAEKKCPACGEAHAVTDPGCPVYKREKANLIRSSRYPESQAPPSLSHA